MLDMPIATISATRRRWQALPSPSGGDRAS